ncbi:MAG: hypothetical protein ACSHW7_11175 [Patiriisocius sp.]|uniref:hypothetical protein n=1 Tax=Patiriisocius sp. TaxID=2822396 RepID=UPI003EF87DE6
MKQIYAPLKLCLFLALFITFFSYSQVGINTTAPEGILDINSSVYGVVLPRIALTASNVQAPVQNPQGGNLAVGTVVFNTATTNNGTNDVVPGLYVWDGTRWFNKFTKKQAEFYTQSGYYLPSSNDGFVSIPGLGNNNFVAEYTGTYKIELSVNYGSGNLENIDGNNNTTDVAIQKGDFRFIFDGDTEIITTKATSVNGASNGGVSNYYLIWEQYSYVIYRNCVKGQTYNFSLAFDQHPSNDFVNNGNYNSGLGLYGQGTGYIGFDIPCSVEITYISE